MSSEEKNAWIMAVVTVIAYATYLVIVLGRARTVSLPEAPYVAAMLWSIGGAIVASILLNVAAGIASPKDCGKKDVRDREIHRFGEYTAKAFVDVGAIAALGMAMGGMSHFWIANAIYLGFVLSSLLGSATKIIAYRTGFQWC